MLSMAIRSLRQNALASVLTALMVALGTGLTLTVLLLADGAQGAFEKTTQSVPILVAGTGGSRIDALLATMFHTGRAPGRVETSYVEKLARDPRVEWVIPIAVGDRVRGFPLVGTSTEFFECLGFRVDGASIAEGRAVVGVHTGLKIGESFFPSHSGAEHDRAHVHEVFTVGGLLQPTGTAHDRAVFVPLADFLGLSGHDAKGVSAAFLKPKNNSPLVIEPLLRDIGESGKAQAIRPTLVVAELIGLFGTAERVLRIVSWLVIAVAAAAVSVSLYNTMAARCREVALLRAVGARRTFIVGLVLTESVLLCAGGALLGLALGHLGASFAAPAIERYAGASFEPGLLLPEEPLIILAIAALGAVAGTLPAMRAYRIDVAAAL
ncbi:MAG: FtsX-like permease family protein [Planctomycetota bacterium]|jgi:putative ABC transport system permease protein